MTHDHSHTEENKSRLADAGFDPVEQIVLHMARRYFLSYTDKARPHWETAMDYSVASFGPALGPGIAYHVMDVLRTMREARKTVFRFTNPCCKACAARLTDCERLLVGTISAARRGDRIRAQMDALIVCEGFDTGPLLRAVARLNTSLALLPGQLHCRAGTGVD